MSFLWCGCHVAWRTKNVLTAILLLELHGILGYEYIFWRSGNDGEAATMDVRAHVLGSYGRNLDQRTCVYQRSAFDEISHDRASTYDWEPAWFYLRSPYDRPALSVSCSSLFFKTHLGTLIPSRPPFSTKTAFLRCFLPKIPTQIMLHRWKSKR